MNQDQIKAVEAIRDMMISVVEKLGALEKAIEASQQQIDAVTKEKVKALEVSMVYTIPEASKYLGMSERTVRRRVIEGRIQGFIETGRWKMTKEALDEFVANRYRMPELRENEDGTIEGIMLREGVKITS